MAFFSKRYHPVGTAPGTLTHASRHGAEPLQIQATNYMPDEISIVNDADISDCGAALNQPGVTWVHVQGRPTEQALRELGSTFQLHPLALEDVLNSGQRPKIEPFDDQLFIVMSLPLMVDELVEVHQASFFLGQNFLVSFAEFDSTPFEPIVKRLQANGSRLRSQNADFLLYSLLDVVIDQGFPVLEHFGLQLEEVEDEILDGANRDTLEMIHTVKRELILLRRMLWPQRDVINQLLRDDYPLIQNDTLVYLRDCYDHAIQVMDLLETYRDMTSSMLDIYLSSVSNRLNETMRVLTVIATIFIPLTFVTGIYGMNFDRAAGPWSMPELGSPYGYPLAWLAMIAIAVAMLAYFRRRDWL